MIKQVSFLIFPFAALVISCGATKSTTDDQLVSAEEINEETVKEETDVNYVIGKVVLSKEGCTVKLILEDEDNACYYPVNLDEMFKVDGAYLQFVKYPSRAPMPPECGSCRTIQVENVVRLKR